jgi:mono/diheme cytochrome c family protein
MVMFMSRIQFQPPAPRSRRRLPRSLAGFAVLCLSFGCGQGPKAEFSWRQNTTELIPAAEKKIKQVMTDDFGTPQDLVGWERMPVNYGGVRGTATAVPSGELKLTLADLKQAEQIQAKQTVRWLVNGKETVVDSFDPKTLEMRVAKAGEIPEGGASLLIGFGSQLQLGRTVYMKNCLHCHGVAGDGNGPTAKYLNPKPRDYRLGIFKFTSTLGPERATRDDLHRIVSQGIPGTYMPSFLLMKEDEKTAVVEYVRWLSMRGEMEKRLGEELADYNEPSIRGEARKANEAYEAAKKGGEKPERPPTEKQALDTAKTSFATYEKEEFDGIVDETANFLAEAWQRADEESSLVMPKVARVADTPESRLRGRVLFMSNRTKCYTCHGPLGRGDGGATDDFWPKPGTNEKFAQRGLHDLWGNKLQPRDLTKGQYRGGRRPVDLYRRLFAGIKGTPMPAFGGTVLKDEEIWDIVNYVLSVPFESPTSSSARPGAMASVPPDENDDH